MFGVFFMHAASVVIGFAALLGGCVVRRAGTRVVEEAEGSVVGKMLVDAVTGIEKRMETSVQSLEERLDKQVETHAVIQGLEMQIAVLRDLMMGQLAGISPNAPTAQTTTVDLQDECGI